MAAMHRYLVERTLDSQTPNHSQGSHPAFVENNASEGVTWVCSYVSPDRRKSFCIYDAPGPEAIRSASMRNGLPLDRITQVSVIAAQNQLQPANNLATTILNG
jgi:hypothetical protein